MLVYGDVPRWVDATVLARAVAEQLSTISTSAPGLGRHEALRRTFLRAADLLTGLADRGDAAELAPLTGLAGALGVSWDTGFARLPALSEAVRAFSHLDTSGPIKVKAMEGYSFYALYPESYWLAARRSGLTADTRVIGIRSIGLGLSAVVTAALGAAPPLTVRPEGHPFERELRVDGQWEQQVFAGDPSAFAIVDEGPGLSGSSFGAVADWLEAHGVGRERIHFFPSHLNDLGPEAREDHRQRWNASTRHFVGADEILLGSGGKLQGWVEGLVGALDEPLEEITGGGWRHLVRDGGELPVEGWWERRKFLAVSGGSRFLVKFAGLGADDEKKLATARLLFEKGLGTEPMGTVGGFLVERWDDAPNLTAVWLDRETLLRELVRYLRFRTNLVSHDAGATLASLREMAVINTGEALGPEAAAKVSARLEPIEAFAERVRPVLIDGRLQRWEWLVDEGRLLKTDALDHQQTHDFIGPQDIAWDIAGAIVEHELTGSEALHLATAVGGDPGLVDLLLLCYLAFQLGAWTMANGSEDEQARRYRDALGRLLTSSRRP